MTDSPASEEDVVVEPAPRRGWGCWLRGVAAIGVLVVIAVALAAVCDWATDDPAPPPERGGLDVGPAENYRRADVNYLEANHIYVVRLPGGEFIALYDRSTKAQELDGDCRVSFNETATPGTLTQIEGMGGAFVEDCEGARTVWRMDGDLAFGAGWGDLDRFETRIDGDGRLIIDTSERSCTRSRGVVGVPPFEERTCRGGVE